MRNFQPSHICMDTSVRYVTQSGVYEKLAIGVRGRRHLRSDIGNELRKQMQRATRKPRASVGAKWLAQLLAD